MDYELIKVDKENELIYNMPIKVENFDFLLNINDVTYPILDDYNIKEFEDENIICINYWANVALIDGTSGELLLFTGLEGSFVGIELLKNRFLIISDLALIMFNNEEFYPIYRKLLPDFVLDYKLIDDDNIKLFFAIDKDEIYCI